MRPLGPPLVVFFRHLRLPTICLLAFGATLAVTITPDFRFSPGAIMVHEGETVAFVITNNNDADHEFVIGDEAVQAQHDADMADGSDEMDAMGDRPYAVDAPAHSTVTLVYTFDKAGTTIVGCHVPGHYAAGMRGTIGTRSWYSTCAMRCAVMASTTG